MTAAIVDEVPDDEEVAGVAHRIDNVQLKIQTLAHRLVHHLVALRQSLLAQMAQIAYRVEALRHWKFRQQQMAELQLDVTAVCNPTGILQRLRIAAKKLSHLLSAFEIKAIVGKAHTARVVNIARRLNAQQYILRLRVLAAHIMQVVCRHQSYAKLLRQLTQALGSSFFLRNIVILDFQKIIVLAKNVDIFLHAATRTVHIAAVNQARHLTGDAGAEADNALAIGAQDVLIYARLIIKAFQLSLADNPHEIVVANIVFGQQNQMVTRFLCHIEMRALRQVHLAADNRLDACLRAFLIKLHCAVHYAVVSNRQAVHPQLLRIGDKLRDFRCAVKQAIFCMYM